jgi:hypothetical protein
VPTGVKILNWTSTMHGGSLRFTTAMLFAVSLVSMFVIGGLSGVMHSVVPVDRHHNDSYFVIAHFHYVLFGGAVFALFGGLYYWWPKITGRLLDEKLGKLNFWLMFVGFNVTFGPMHFLGVDGMPRRVYTYSPEQGWAMWNMVVTIGAFILTAGVLVFIYNVVVTMTKPRTAGADPWDGATLEWSIPSPPPVYNFLVEPVVHSRDPLWAAKGRHNPEAGENVATIAVGGAEVAHARVEEDVPDEERTAREAERRGIGATVAPGTDPHAPSGDGHGTNGHGANGHGTNGHGDGHGIHLPNPSFFPMISAFGVTIMLAGLIFGVGFSIAGLLYLLVGIGGWALEPTG